MYWYLTMYVLYMMMMMKQEEWRDVSYPINRSLE